MGVCEVGMTSGAVCGALSQELWRLIPMGNTAAFRHPGVWAMTKVKDGWLCRNPEAYAIHWGGLRKNGCKQEGIPSSSIPPVINCSSDANPYNVWL